jgi:hypothetical protein
VQAQNGYVNLGFFFGTDLADPSHVLEGTGKRMRHVKIRSIKEAGALSLPALVQDAWRKGVSAVAELHSARKKAAFPLVRP